MATHHTRLGCKTRVRRCECHIMNGSSSSMTTDLAVTIVTHLGNFLFIPGPSTAIARPAFFPMRSSIRFGPPAERRFSGGTCNGRRACVSQHAVRVMDLSLHQTGSYVAYTLSDIVSPPHSDVHTFPPYYSFTLHTLQSRYKDPTLAPVDESPNPTKLPSLRRLLLLRGFYTIRPSAPFWDRSFHEGPRVPLIFIFI